MLVAAPEFGFVAGFGWTVVLASGWTVVVAAAVAVEGFVWQLAGR